MSLSSEALVTLTQAKNFLRLDAAATLRIDAEYVGIGTGSATAFSLDNTPIVGSLQLYVNGTLQVEGSEKDYTISGVDITFVTVPPSGHQITASYDKVASDSTFESYDDELLENLINSATKKAEDYTGRAFIRRAINEIRIGDNKVVLKLHKRPVVSVSAVSVGGDTLTTHTERLSIGRLYHPTIWPLDYEIIVDYIAGYAATRTATQALVPDAVIAVLIAVAVAYENRLGIKSQNISGIGSVDYGDPEGLPEASRKKLDSLKVNIL